MHRRYKRYHAIALARCVIEGNQFFRFKRYMERYDGPVISWGPDRKAYIERPMNEVGLRYVARVTPGGTKFTEQEGFLGWFTNNHGEYSGKDGNGAGLGYRRAAAGQEPRGKVPCRLSGGRYGPPLVIDFARIFIEPKMHGSGRPSTPRQRSKQRRTPISSRQTTPKRSASTSVRTRSVSRRP